MIPFIDLKVNNSTPQYIQLYNYFKNEIIGEKLQYNTRLPSVRKLADYLSISTTPVEMAYGQLLSEGFIKSKPRSGYYVEKIFDGYCNIDNSVKYERETTLLRNQKFEYDFHISKNDFNYFPFSIWKRLYCQCVNEKQKDLLFYGDPQGEEELRIEVAKYLRKYRGVVCEPTQIVIGAEQHQLTSILSFILKEHSMKLAVENPSYLLIPETFKLNGYEIKAINVEEDGINIDKLYDSNAKVVCVSPSHQFPKGIIMPIAKRLKLINWAKQREGYIIEDDYDGEFRYHGRPIPALQGISQDNVIYIGGFSQVLAPAIGVNYMVLPSKLINLYEDLKFNILLEQSSSRIHQRALSLFIQEGYLEKHIRKMRIIYRRKHDIAVRSIKKFFWR
jgi:GntR family transcriptional regulator/MocR family aminotransferase